MNLKLILSSLTVTNFVDDNTRIQIVVNKGKSYKTTDKIFDCYIPVKQAKEFFGELNVTVNQIRKNEESGSPVFWFLLAYEEKDND